MARRVVLAGVLRERGHIFSMPHEYCRSYDCIPLGFLGVCKVLLAYTIGRRCCSRFERGTILDNHMGKLWDDIFDGMQIALFLPIRCSILGLLFSSQISFSSLLLALYLTMQT